VKNRCHFSGRFIRFHLLLSHHIPINPGKIPDQWKSQFRWNGSSELQRFVMLQMDGGAKLELFQYQGTEINQTQPHGDEAGASHLALHTADIDGSLASPSKRSFRNWLAR
jgi:hypothetical protein